MRLLLCTHFFLCTTSQDEEANAWPEYLFLEQETIKKNDTLHVFLDLIRIWSCKVLCGRHSNFSVFVQIPARLILIF